MTEETRDRVLLLVCMVVLFVIGILGLSPILG